jgi:hypothetical protein
MKTLIVGPNAVTAKTIFDLADLFTSDNCIRVFKTDGSYKSWSPVSPLNAITACELDKGYLVVMKEELEVSESFLSMDDIGVSPTFSMITKSTAQDLQVKFVDTNGTTILSTKNVLHATAGVTGDLTPFLGKKIKFGRSNYNCAWYLTMKTISSGVQIISSILWYNDPNFIASIPADCTELNLVLDNHHAIMSGRVVIVPGDKAKAVITLSLMTAEDLPIHVSVQQDDPIGGTTVLTPFDLVIPQGQSFITHEFDISALANPNYLEIASITFTSPDYGTLL